LTGESGIKIEGSKPINLEYFWLRKLDAIV